MSKGAAFGLLMGKRLIEIQLNGKCFKGQAIDNRIEGRGS
jgi:hypothetical protein